MCVLVVIKELEVKKNGNCCLKFESRDHNKVGANWLLRQILQMFSKLKAVSVHRLKSEKQLPSHSERTLY